MTIRQSLLLTLLALLLWQLSALLIIASQGEHVQLVCFSHDNLRSLIFFAILSSFILAALLYRWLSALLGNLDLLLSDSFWKSGSKLPFLGRVDLLGSLVRAMRDLRTSNREYSQRENLIADHALDVICSLDEDSLIMAISPAAYKQMGYAPTALVGSSLEQIVIDRDLSRLKQGLSRAKDQANAETVELIIKTASGELKDFRWTLEWSGTAGIYFCTARDISAQKELERVKQEFLSMISHDLKTPITGVHLVLSVMAKSGLYGDLNEKGLAQIQACRHNLDRMIKLTNDLLDMDKLDCGQLELARNPFRLEELLLKSLESVRHVAEDRQILLLLKNNCQPELELSGDIDRLVQVLVNLLSNAIKFSAGGQPVELQAEAMPLQIEIKVIDQGKGIPKTHLALIFERYKQVSSGDKRGAGLGLSIAKGLVEAHQGQIGVTSEEGKGSTFWLTIPRMISPSS